MRPRQTWSTADITAFNTARGQVLARLADPAVQATDTDVLFCEPAEITMLIERGQLTGMGIPPRRRSR